MERGRRPRGRSTSLPLVAIAWALAACEPLGVAPFGDPAFGLWVDNRSEHGLLLLLDGTQSHSGRQFDHSPIAVVPARTVTGHTGNGSWSGTVRVFSAAPACEELSRHEWVGRLAMLVIEPDLTVSLVPDGHPPERAGPAVWERETEYIESADVLPVECLGDNSNRWPTE